MAQDPAQAPSSPDQPSEPPERSHPQGPTVAHDFAPSSSQQPSEEATHPEPRGAAEGEGEEGGGDGGMAAFVGKDEAQGSEGAREQDEPVAVVGEGGKLINAIVTNLKAALAPKSPEPDDVPSEAASAHQDAFRTPDETSRPASTHASTPPQQRPQTQELQRSETPEPMPGQRPLHEVVIPPSNASHPSSIRSVPLGVPQSPQASPDVEPSSPAKALTFDDKVGGETNSILTALSSAAGSRRRKKKRAKRERALSEASRGEDGLPSVVGEPSVKRSATGRSSLRKAMAGGLGWKKLKRRSKEVLRDGARSEGSSSDSEGSTASGDEDEEEGREVGQENRGNGEDGRVNGEKPTDAQAVARRYRQRFVDGEVASRRASSEVEREGKKDAEEADGQVLHKATQCACGDDGHFDAVAMDETFPTTVDKIYTLMFTDVDFIKKVWTDQEKLKDIEIGEWENIDKGNGNSSGEPLRKRETTYIRPLPGSFGPKATKCLMTEENVHLDFSDYVTSVTTTRTPDVPCGNNFVVKTKTCLTYVEGGGTRALVTTGVEWSKVNRMLRGVVEKSAIAGQKTTHEHVTAAIRQHLHEHRDDLVIAGSRHSTSPPSTSEHATYAPAQEQGVNALSSGAAQTAEHAPKLEGFFSQVIETLGGPVVAALLALVLVLALSNWWTWRAMKYYRSRTAEGIVKDAEAMKSAVGQLERRLEGLKARLGEVRMAR